MDPIRGRFGNLPTRTGKESPADSAGLSFPIRVTIPSPYRVHRARLVAGPRHLPVRVPKAVFGVGNMEFGIGEIANGGAKAN